MGLPFGRAYFGSTVGLPPGLPGGRITGVVPGFGTGAGADMSGAMPSGGRITPSLRLSFSLKVSPDPAVEPVLDGSCGAIFSGIVELFWGVGKVGG